MKHKKRSSRSAHPVASTLNNRPAVANLRPEADSALVAPLALLAAAFDSAPCGFAVFDRDLRCLHLNECLARLNGLPVKAHVGRPLAEVLPRTSQMIGPLLTQVLTTLAPVVNVELQAEGASAAGQQRHLLATCYPVKLDFSAASAVALVVQEITELKEQEQELLRKTRELQSIIEHAPDMIVRFDQNIRYFFSNPAIERATGFAPEQIVGKSFAELGFPEEIYTVWEAHIVKAFETGQENAFEYSFPTPAGVRHYFSLIVPEQGEHNAVQSVLSITRDITELKRAKERLHFLAEASMLLSGSLDYHATLRALARLTVPHHADYCLIDLFNQDGHTEGSVIAAHDPASETLLKEIRRRSPPNPTRAESPITQAWRTGRTVCIAETPEWLVRSYQEYFAEFGDVSHLIARSIVSIPLISRGHVWGVMTIGSTTPRFYTDEDVAMMEEIARRAAVAIDNARLYHETQQAIELRDRFLSVVAHELKTPVTSLLSYGQLLQRRVQREHLLSARDQQAFDQLMEQIDRLHRMTNALLDLSRLQTTRLVFEPQRLDLCELLRRLVDELRLTLASHRVELRVPDTPLIVEGDELQLRQVFINLLENAAKYSPDCDIISVQLEGKGNQIRVAIRDYGIGIPSDALSNIFTLFYRANNAKGSGESGIGVGLAVVKDIISLHGGTIEVESTEGQGSRFTVVLTAL